MAEILTLKVSMPKRRIFVLRMAIYVLAAGYHLGLISLARVESVIPRLAAWAGKGIRVR